MKKRGRPPTFQEPDQLWQAFLRYEKHTKAQPRLVMDFVGSEGRTVYRQKEVPLTFCGFELWLQEEGLCHGLSNYTKASSKHHQRFSEVLRMVKTCCAADIIEGALVGIYKPHLAWRYVQSSLNNTLCLTRVTRAREEPLASSQEVFSECC